MCNEGEKRTNKARKEQEQGEVAYIDLGHACYTDDVSLFALLIVRWIKGKKKKRNKGRKNAGAAKRDGRIETREALCKLDEQRERKRRNNEGKRKNGRIRSAFKMMRVDKKRRCSHPARRTVFDRGRE